MFELYLDGLPVKTVDTEDEAEAWCELYDGDKEPSYEYIGETDAS